MLKRYTILIAALIAAPASAKPEDIGAYPAPKYDTAEMIASANVHIKQFEAKNYEGEVFCSSENLSDQNTAPESGPAYVEDDICFAYYLKGYALIDQGRHAEAGPYLKRATELAPSNGNYLNEYAEWHKFRHDWRTAHDLFEKSTQLPYDLSDDDERGQLCRAHRGVGFTLIEMNQLDEADAAFDKCLALTPGEPKSLNEKAYIKQLRAQ